MLRTGYGLADPEARRTYTPGTVQDTLSVTEPFAAAAVPVRESRVELRTEDPITLQPPQSDLAEEW